MQIADDAFEGCEGLVAEVSAGSYAHAYCEENDIAYIFNEDETLYAITGLTLEGAQFSAVATTDQACVLRVEVLPENGETVLHTVEGLAQASLSMEAALLAVPQDVVLPTYYVLRAVLISEDGYALCAPYTTVQYTEAFAQFEDLKPSDFEESIVMDFGSSGFGVLREGAVKISGTAARSGSDYTFPCTYVPEEGAVLVLTLSDGTQEPVKVKTAQDNGDGTVTVQRDPDTTLSDLYEVFKLDTKADVGSAARSGGVARVAGENADGAVSLSSGLTAGPLSVTVTGTASVVVKTFYNEKLFGDEFVEMQTYVELNATAKTELSAAIKSSELKDAFGSPIEPKIVLYDGPIVIPDTGVVAVDLEVSIPLDFEFGAGGSYTLEISNKTGVKYTPENGSQPIKSTDTDSRFELEGSFMVQAGPKVELSVVILHSILEASVSGQVGLRATGKAVHVVQDIETSAKTHACEWCCDMEVSVFGDAKADIVAQISEKCRQTLLAVNLLKLNYPIGKAFFSIVNEEESLFGGEKYFDWGECPNYKYRTFISTKDHEGNDVSGVPVAVTKDGGERGSGTSPYKVYLYDGDYVAQAEFESGVSKKEFEVLRAEQIVTVSEQHIELSGTVTDAGEKQPAEGAQVSVMLPEGEPLTTSTGADGSYKLSFPPVESFTLSFTKDGYMTWTRTVTPGAEERKITIDAQLVPATYNVSFDANGGSGSMEGFTVSVGDGFTLPGCSFTPPEGKKFSSWTIGTDSYLPGSTYDSASGDVVVVAVWKDDPIPDDAVYYNGHAYKYYDIAMGWDAAQAYCQALGGHLVSITSDGEQGFVHAYASQFGFKGYVWIGMTNPWSDWVTGEPVAYTNWGEGEPDRANQNYGCMLVNDEYSGSGYHIAPGQWDNWQGPSTVFVCEWDNMRLVSFDVNGGSELSGMAVAVGEAVGALPVPTRDGYEFVGWNTAADGSGEPVTPGTIVTENLTIYAQWKEWGQAAPEGSVIYNGHAYKLFDEYYTWTDALAVCNETGGYLAVITDAQEQAFLLDYVKQAGNRNVYWIGMSCEENETWNWVTGEPFDYDNPDKWGMDYWGSAPYYGAFANFDPKGTWIDMQNEGYISNDTSYTFRYPTDFGYLCEWSLQSDE